MTTGTPSERRDSGAVEQRRARGYAAKAAGGTRAADGSVGEAKQITD